MKNAIKNSAADHSTTTEQQGNVLGDALGVSTLSPTAPTMPSFNPFDPKALALSQNYGDTFQLKKVLNTVPVGKPPSHDFVRVHPAPEWRLTTGIVEIKEDREYWLIAPQMRGHLAAEIKPVTLYTTVNRQGVVRLLVVKLPGPDGKANQWHESLNDAAQFAMTHWVRIQANMSLGAYDCTMATGALGDPAWPTESFSEVLRVAFKDKLVETPDHPLCKRLRGEI